jgi:hypothetical protein
MRASSHYVEQLDSESFSSPIRYLDANGIDTRGEEAHPSEAFVDSIRRHGVLQPLLVQGREGRYRLIAGRGRLAAAIAAGLREVPCLVQRVGEHEAALLAEATNLAAEETPAPPEATPPVSAGDVTGAALSRCLASLMSSTHLLTATGTLGGSIAVDLVKAEAARAVYLVAAARVLRGEPSLKTSVSAETVIDRAVRETDAEARLRGVAIVVRPYSARSIDISSDPHLLSAAVGSLLLASMAIVEGRGSRTMMLSAGVEHEQLRYSISQESVAWPATRVARIFDGGMEGPEGDTLNILLRAASVLAAEAGGAVNAEATERGTRLSLAIPIEREGGS